MREQQDDHIWVTLDRNNWAIHRIKGKTLWFWRGYEPNLEFAFVDITNFDEDAYCKAAVEMLEKEWSNGQEGSLRTP